MCAAVKLDNFGLADKQRSASLFFRDFTRPTIVRIVQVDGDYALSAPQFAKNAFWVFDKHRQKRVLFRSTNDRYVSISLDSSIKLHIVHRYTAGPTSTLKELFKNTRCVGDLKVALDDDPDFMLSNRPDLTNAVAYGELTAVAVMEEACLVCQAMNGSTLETRLTLISTKAPLVLDSVVKIKWKSSSHFRQRMDALGQQQLQSTTALLASSSPSDIVLLGEGDDGQHINMLYIASKDRSVANNIRHSQVVTHLDSKDKRSSGDGDKGSEAHLFAQDRRPDIESLRRRFEKSGPKRDGEEDLRLGLPQGPPLRTCSERGVATLPPLVSNFRSQQKSRSLSREDLVFDWKESPWEQPILNQTHTRSLADVLGIGDEASRSPFPLSSPGCYSNLDEEAGYESIKAVTGLSAPYGLVSTAKNANCSASDSVAQSKVSRPPPPDPRTFSVSQPKAKLQSRLEIGLHRKNKDRPPAPEQYETIRRIPTEEHEYAELTELKIFHRMAEPVKRSKWKTASEIPRDLNVASFTVDEVARCLELLKLRKYARKFKERDVDGAVLVTVTEAMLVESFKMDQIDARKLVMFARENWRPAK